MKSFLDNAKTAATENVEKVYVFSKQVGENLNHYFSSNAYEDDLDEVISFLYILKPAQARNFKVIKSRKLRVAMKMKFIMSQARLLVGASAAIGAEIGLTFAGPQGALTGATIGTATGALVITYVAGRILFKRVSAGTEFALALG